MTVLQSTKTAIKDKDISGERFFRLVAVSRSEKSTKHWDCLCDCGNTCAVSIYNLLRGISKSCGCYSREVSRANVLARTTHGRRKRADGQKSDPTYRAWVAMNLRCNKENSQPYANYGGRGISICDRWSVFESFLEDMGNNPGGLTLDRIDNNLGYCKENCKWSTYTDQNRNKRGVKLTMELANKIRQDDRPHHVIAVDYGVSRSNIGYVKRGKIWADNTHG